jgi:hypothetical protein
MPPPGGIVFSLIRARTTPLPHGARRFVHALTRRDAPHPHGHAHVFKSILYSRHFIFKSKYIPIFNLLSLLNFECRD